jgi:hypothetical protein
MEKKYQIIYIWSFIIISGLILLMLYTPLGGRLHQSIGNRSEIITPSVDFGGQIGNSPKFAQNNYQRDDEAGTEIASAERKQAGVLQSAPVSNSDGFNQSMGQDVNRTSRKYAATSTASGTETLAGGVLTHKKNGNSISNSNLASANINQPFSDNGTANAPVQRANNANNNTLADPGGVPLGQPIPVGDGMVVLIVLSIGYLFVKFNSKKLEKFKLHHKYSRNNKNHSA